MTDDELLRAIDARLTAFAKQQERAIDERLGAFTKQQDELLRAIWNQMGELSRGLHGQMQQINTHMDAFEKRLERIETKLDAFEKHTQDNFARVQRNFDRVGLRLDALETN